MSLPVSREGIGRLDRLLVEHAAIFDSAMATIDGWIVNVALPAIERCGQHLADREW